MEIFVGKEENMTILLGINGFGKVGRSVFYASLYDPTVAVVAINDTSSSTEYIAFLMEHEVPPQHRIPVKAVAANDHTIMVNGTQRIEITHSHDACTVGWGKVLVAVVMECSGLFSTRERCWGHITGGAGAVIVATQSADAPLILPGINDTSISEALPVFCTGNIVAAAIAPIIDLFAKCIGLEEISYTSIVSPLPIDPAAKRSNDPLEWRQARLESSSVVVPHRTAGVTTLVKAFPKLDGKITGSCFQIPAQTGCTVDLLFRTSKPMSKEQLDHFMINAAGHPVYGEALEHRPGEVAYVSSDTLTTYKVLYDQRTSQSSANGLTHKLVLWVDLQNNLAHRLLDLAKKTGAALVNRVAAEGNVGE